VDRKRRAGPEAVWDAFTAANKSDLDLSADGQPKLASGQYRGEFTRAACGGTEVD